ncbi:hypothetical protein B9Z55_010417 [Caenorhabditis nigoni]|uniref:C3H1-type domain-containing protein n=1 Tax=Caenorhabditis nigoni TaxID=1611254 RepID=A0A2G5UFP9_9PELO|nr:hypothetical protein B9Z55_010417 [Caenorhabditis nigoni]
MYTIRKRKVPELPKSILRRERKNPDTPRKVGFYDDIGKPLVDYRYLPSRDSEAAIDHSLHAHASGKLICHPDNVVNHVKWNLLSVKNAKKPHTGPSEMRKIEEKRLDDNNISRAPLFGTSEIFEPPNLIADANLRAQKPVPNIPLTNDFDDSPQVSEPQHTYEQVFENGPGFVAEVNEPAKPQSSSVFDLLNQLKQRGFLAPAEQQPQPFLDNTNPMPSYRPSSRFSYNGRSRGPCIHYITKPKGCLHGDRCRFEHDDVKRANYQKDLQTGTQRNDTWRYNNPRQHRTPYRNPGERQSRFDRSRSPQTVS